MQRIANNNHTITIQSLITFMVNNIEYFNISIALIQERNYNFTDQQQALHHFKKVSIRQA